MGNAKSSMQPPLALIAVSRQLRLQRCQMVALRDALKTFQDGEGYVDRECFALSLKRAKIVYPGDVEIFDLLFIMWDGSGNEKIPYKEFAVGVSPLACPNDDVVSIVRFALYIQDEFNTAMITPKALQTLLRSIQITASYFGDAQLSVAEINAVVEAVFEAGRSLLTHSVCAHRLHANAYVKRFVTGTVQRNRVQFKRELAMVTEFDKVECPSLIDGKGGSAVVISSPNWEGEYEKLMIASGTASNNHNCPPTTAFEKAAEVSVLTWESILSNDDDDGGEDCDNDSQSTGSFSKRTRDKVTVLASPCNLTARRPPSLRIIGAE